MSMEWVLRKELLDIPLHDTFTAHTCPSLSHALLPERAVMVCPPVAGFDSENFPAQLCFSLQLRVTAALKLELDSGVRDSHILIDDGLDLSGL